METELSDAIASGVASRTGSLAPEFVTVACAVASLDDDQRLAVTRLCSQGNAIEIVNVSAEAPMIPVDRCAFRCHG